MFSAVSHNFMKHFQALEYFCAGFFGEQLNNRTSFSRGGSLLPGHGLPTPSCLGLQNAIGPKTGFFMYLPRSIGAVVLMILSDSMSRHRSLLLHSTSVRKQAGSLWLGSNSFSIKSMTPCAARHSAWCKVSPNNSTFLNCRCSNEAASNINWRAIAILVNR